MAGLFSVSWHGVRLYRIADRLYRRGHVRAAEAVSAFNRVLTGIEIEPGAELGNGLVIRHGHGIVVSRYARVGLDCHLFQQVTLGVDWHGPPGGPVLGNRVIVFAGAKIIGPLKIGDDAVIGANAVVLCDVPDGCVAVGVPAHVIEPSGVPRREVADEPGIPCDRSRRI